MTRKDQKKRGEVVRQTILATALQIGLKEGCEALSVRKISKAMGYSTGVVYHHFRDKQEIIDAIEASQTENMRQRIASLLDSSKSIVENMAAAFHEVMLLALHEPEKYNLIVLHKYSRKTISRPQWIPYLSRELKKGMETGLIRPMDPDKMAFTIWSSFLGFNLTISRQTNLTLAQAEKFYQTQLDIILKGALNHEDSCNLRYDD
jgi:AcrR family transcriptional regulator